MKKKLKYLILILCEIILFACKSGGEEGLAIPKNVLSEEKYIKLLVDLSLAESAGNINIKAHTGRKFDSVYAFNPLQENNISKADYDSSVIFYSKRPKLYKKIFDEVLVTLSKMEAARKAVKSEAITKAKKDSLLKNETLGATRKDTLIKKENRAKKDTVLKITKAKKKKRNKKKQA